jgi:integrase
LSCFVSICRTTETDKRRQTVFRRFRYAGNAGEGNVTTKLTTLAVKNAKPKRNRFGAPERAEIPDGDGLYLVVQPSGARSFTLRYRFGGRTRNLRLGDTALSEAEAANGALTLAAARVRAAEARLQIERGIDPGVNKAAYSGTDQVETLVAQFLELHAYRKTRPGSAQATERIFRRVVLPAWRGRSIHGIRRRDVIELIEKVVTERPVLANRTLAALSKFGNWLLARDVIPTSFTTGVPRPHREVPRSHTLGAMELRALWLATVGDDPAARAVRLMLLSGCRRNEVGHMRWSEIDPERRLWVIPSERSKNHRQHAVPLSTQAWAILASTPRLVGCDFLFSLDGRVPINHWGGVKDRLSAKAGIDPKSWRLHDLRRTCAAGMQALGIPVAVIEKALNHVGGEFRGITGVYQVHDYAGEIRAALQRWADHVDQLNTGKPAKVLPMRGRQR